MNDIMVDSVDAKLEAIGEGLELGKGHIEPFQLARAREDITAVRRRMDLGIDLTVVALVGGTGSGKSTTFNAISNLDFADSGELRPTTERATACTWGGDASAMLDFLGVDEDRRIRKASILTDEEPEFEGLVLLDLPDHDSVAVAHSVQVSQLMPLVDLLVWVLDPQKYADQALHAGYLKGLERRQDSMVVVLNQIDTVPFDQRDRIVEDVKDVLKQDGLDGVPVISASALENQGIDELKIHIAAAVSKPSINAVTASAEISAIANRLLSSVGSSEADVTDESLEPITQQLSRAAGIRAVGDSLRESGESWRQHALAKPEQPATSTVDAIRDGWLDSAKRGLPVTWAKTLTDEVAGPERLRRRVNDAVTSVPLTKPSAQNAGILLGLGILLMLAGVGFGVATALGAGFPFAEAMGNWILAGILVLVGLWAFFMAGSVRRSAAKRAADRYEKQVDTEIHAVLRENLAEPAQDVLSRHRRTREALEKASE